jgi:hypothetical protein
MSPKKDDRAFDKSVKISILKQKKKRKLYGFQIKLCEDKKLCFCDAVHLKLQLQ